MVGSAEHVMRGLEMRLAGLEARNKRYKLVLILIGLASCGLAAMGQGAPVSTEVRANSFVLVDVDGNSRGVLQCDESGRPSLTFADRTGVVRGKFGETTDGSVALGLCDEKGLSRVAIDLRHGNPAITFRDAKRQPLVSLHHTGISGGVSVWDVRGGGACELLAGAGGSRLDLRSTGKHVRTILISQGSLDGRGIVRVVSADGKQVVSLPETK